MNDIKNNWCAFAVCVMSKYFSVSRSLRKFKLISNAEYQSEKTPQDALDLKSWSRYTLQYQRKKCTDKRARKDMKL